MVDCTDNTPPKNRSLVEFIISELDPTGYIGEESECDWIAKNVAFADFCGIDLCDEAEAHLLADFVVRVTENSMGATPVPQTPEAVSGYHHHEFMISYANLHGIAVPEVPRRNGYILAADVQAEMPPRINRTDGADKSKFEVDLPPPQFHAAQMPWLSHPCRGLRNQADGNPEPLGKKDISGTALHLEFTRALGLEHADLLKKHADGVTSRRPPRRASQSVWMLRYGRQAGHECQ